MGEKEFVAAGIGQFLFSVAIVIILIQQLFLFNFGVYRRIGLADPYFAFAVSAQSTSVIGVGASLLIIVSFSLFLFSTLRTITRLRASVAGVVGAFFGLSYAMATAGYNALAFTGAIFSEYILSFSLVLIFPNYWGIVVSIVTGVLIGVTMVLLAVFFVSCRHNFNMRRLCIATGIIYLLGGILNLGVNVITLIYARYPGSWYDIPNYSLLPGVLALSLAVPASILGLICFFKSTFGSRNLDGKKKE